MNQVSYNSKELLSELILVETSLIDIISKNYPSREFILTEDTDKALEELLQYQTVEDDNAGYISTELALFYLRKELEKTIDIVVIANDLRAHYDFNKLQEKTIPNTTTAAPKKPFKFFLGGVVFGVLITALIYSFLIL